LELFFLQHAGTTMKRLTVALIAALSSPLVLAVEKPYMGIDYQFGTYQVGATEVSPEAFRLTGGTELNPYLAVEAQAALGTQTDVYATNGVSYDIKVKSFYSLFVRPQLSISNVASIYGLLGGTYIDVSSSSNNANFASDKGFEKSFSYGAGIDFNISQNLRLNADYIRYMDNYNAISFGIRIPIN
jgi:outer membrane autotransporter protein